MPLLVQLSLAGVTAPLGKLPGGEDCSGTARAGVMTPLYLSQGVRNFAQPPVGL